jgi:hypothetical protein
VLSPNPSIRAPRFVEERKGFETLRPWWWWIAFVAMVSGLAALTWAWRLSVAGYPW